MSKPNLVDMNKTPKPKGKNNNIDSNNNNDSLDLNSIISGKKTKKATHDFRGYYLELEVIKVIDRLTDGKGKGVKSELVNEILKAKFKEEGWM